jgi:hypothetical protein
MCLFVLISGSAFAQDVSGSVKRNQRKIKSSTRNQPVKRDSGVPATVRTDGAMVYSKPDFDAAVLGNLRRGDRVRVSSGSLGDYAKFHKVSAGPIVGWIADIDVQVEGAAKKRDHKRGAKNAGRPTKEKKPFVDESLPLFFSKYVGVLVGLSEFNESISGVESHETLLVYGLKFTGPDILLTGPVMDFNLALHYGAPSYYSRLSSTKPSGFIIQSDALFLYPFFNREKVIVAFGLGPLLKFSSFNVTSGGDIKSLSEFDVGVSLALSGAVKVGKVALRLEGKYLVEKHQEKLVQLAVQQQF